MLSDITDVKFVKGVGEKRAQLLKKLGINSVGASFVILSPCIQGFKRYKVDLRYRYFRYGLCKSKNYDADYRELHTQKYDIV